jgi:hypothetical protein
MTKLEELEAAEAAAYAAWRAACAAWNAAYHAELRKKQEENSDD